LYLGCGCGGVWPKANKSKGRIGDVEGIVVEMLDGSTISDERGGDRCGSRLSLWILMMMREKRERVLGAVPSALISQS
jgi:hypothetical protein